MLGQSLAAMLGGRQRDRVLAYGTVYPLGETPDAVRLAIDRGLARGLRAIKIVADPFWREDLALTESLIRAARDHCGPDIQLMVDAATAWAQHWDDEPCEYSTSTSPLRWELTREDFPIGPDGRIAVPEEPGLGVSLNLATVAKYRLG